MIKKAFEPFQGQFATDFVTCIISWNKLDFSRVSQRIAEGTSYKIAFQSGREKVNEAWVPKQESITLSAPRRVPMQELLQYVDGQLEAEGKDLSEITGTLNVLVSYATSQIEGPHESFQVGNNKFFLKHFYTPLDGYASLIVCHEGFSTNIQRGMGNVLLNVNNATSAFFNPMMLDNFIDIFRNRNPGLEQDQKRQLEKILRGVRVLISYRRGASASLSEEEDEFNNDVNNRIKTIAGLGERLDSQHFQAETGPVSVFDYLQRKFTPNPSCQIF